ncbi:MULTISPECIES: T9SS type A sorting domain-containing protein [Niastella]|uniref:T9SS type A sorting domain-containing protein n=1 Tax=Niastella soli TaxID=2821487 RepID=A0ABS3Z2Q9_9BACT|nr:T9SS type A sorting domain-containing protein [Niastella soli]MBO9204450.1 T9SS type A sorting domain-containing protein [Niastella soli]
MKQLYRSNGMSMCIHCTPLPITLSLLFLLLFTITGHAQVNAYAKVSNITTVSGKSMLTITNSINTYHGWVAGEEVIVIQMQDDVIGSTINDLTFGSLLGISSAGLFEVATISSTAGSTITLSRTLTNTYHTGSNASVQVVSLTPFGSPNYTTTGNITAVPWDGSKGTGGIVAITVPGTFTLRHAINVDGQGFAGGVASGNNEPGCITDIYISNSPNYGAKGEGIYLNTNANYNRGRGRMLSGGGGGNFTGAGGAGGSNFSAGGSGTENPGCGSGGGLGGLALGTYMLAGNRAFLGGGGGGGQGNSSQSKGGNGGGIVFIRAGTLTTSCGSPKISANGIDAGSSGTYGAGGGGAAGSILLQIGSYSVSSGCSLTMQANGGDGGDAGGFFQWGGGGGGGGQGAVLVSGTSLMTNIIKNTIPGAGGSTGWLTADAPSGAGPNNGGVQGGIGVILPVRLLYFGVENKNEKAVLKWTIADESNVTYLVERSTDGINFTSIGTVTGTGQSNYTFTDPEPLSGRVYYRLVLTGADFTAKTTYSSIVNVSLSDVLKVATAYPNPAHDHFYIRITGDNNNQPHKIAVTDLTGKLVYSSTGIPVNNIIKVTPAQVLKPGLYVFKVTSNGTEQTGKLMIQ